MEITVAGNAPQDFKDKLLAQLTRDVAKPKPVYTIKSSEPDSPCVDVYKDGKLRSSFAAAKAWVEHVTKWDAQS